MANEGFESLNAGFNIADLGLEGQLYQLILLLLLAKNRVLSLKAGDVGFKLLHIDLLAFARVLCGLTVAGLPGFQASSSLLVCGLLATGRSLGWC